METIHKYIKGISPWMKGRKNDFGCLISKVTEAVKKVLEKVKSSSVQKTKPVITEPSPKISEPQRNNRMKSSPDTKNPDRIFQMGIVGLGISFIGLIIGGIIYLIIVWVMR
jgi:hypothetical protein